MSDMSIESTDEIPAETEDVKEPTDVEVEDEPVPAADPEVPATVEVAEEDFPSAEENEVQRGDVPDPNEGWTVQSKNTFFVTEDVPGYTVQKHELPTVEGLKAHGVDPVAYVAGVAVVD